MAIKLISNYSKRLGLPGYSSHQFSVSIETELATTDNVAHEAARIYELLQTTVDAEMQKPGYIAPHDYGMDTSAPQATAPTPGNVLPIAQHSDWQCSPKQQELILRLIEENDNLGMNDIEQLALQRFRKGVKQLNKLEASGVIDTIFQSLLKDRAPSKSYQKGGQR